MADPVAEFIKYKNGYVRERGIQSLTADGKAIPKTTWGDVIAFYETFLEYTDPPEKTLCTAAGICQKVPTFAHTSSFNRAKIGWEKVSPYYLAAKEAGVNPLSKEGRATGITLAVLKVPHNEPYPWNAQFWKKGKAYAIARSAAGAVPYKMDLAIESIVWSIKSAPDSIGKWAGAIDPRKFLPDIDPWVRLLKWGTIAAGLGMLYWYVLRPKPR